MYCGYNGCVFCFGEYFFGYTEELLTLQTVSVDRDGVEHPVEVILVVNGASYEVTKRVTQSDGTVLRTPPRIGGGCPLMDEKNLDLIASFLAPRTVAALTNV